MASRTETRKIALGTPAAKKTLSARHALQSARIVPGLRSMCPAGLPVSTTWRLAQKRWYKEICSKNNENFTITARLSREPREEIRQQYYTSTCVQNKASRTETREIVLGTPAGGKNFERPPRAPECTDRARTSINVSGRASRVDYMAFSQKRSYEEICSKK